MPEIAGFSALFAQALSRNENINAPRPATTILFQDTVNNDVFWGAAPGQVKCAPIKTTRQVKQLPSGSNFVYLECEYEFHFLASWDIQVLDAGDYYNSQTSMSVPPDQTPFLDKNQQPIVGLLDGNGHALATGGNPVYVTVRPYFRMAFAALNLPQSFNSGVQ